MALIPPQFLDCVLAIGFGDDPATRKFAATGFLYGRHAQADDYNVFLITNRHVFAGEASAWLRFNPKGGAAAREYFIRLNDEAGEPAWSGTDGVDLAAIGINANMLLEHGIRFSFFQSDKHVLTLDEAKASGVSEGDGVFALGFPMGLVGGEHSGRTVAVV